MSSICSLAPTVGRRREFPLLPKKKEKNPSSKQKLTCTCRKKIESHLAASTTIISDRYYHSGIVYSAAKLNPSLPLPWARAPETGLPRPDLVAFLDLDEETARSRGGWGDEKYEKAEMQKRVRELFWGLSMGGKDAAGGGLWEGVRLGEGAWRQEEEDLVVIDAGGSVEDVAERIWKRASGRVREVEAGEIGHVVRRVV